jgi:hypothetical protein
VNVGLAHSGVHVLSNMNLDDFNTATFRVIHCDKCAGWFAIDLSVNNYIGGSVLCVFYC